MHNAPCIMRNALDSFPASPSDGAQPQKAAQNSDEVKKPRYEG